MPRDRLPERARADDHSQGPAELRSSKSLHGEGTAEVLRPQGWGFCHLGGRGETKWLSPCMCCLLASELSLFLPVGCGWRKHPLFLKDFRSSATLPCVTQHPGLCSLAQPLPRP